MDINEHTTPDKLERYSFLWSEARLIIAALALFLGGYPPVIYFSSYLGLGMFSSMLYSLLTVAWIISGVVSLYLAYRWYAGGQMVFGGKDTKDIVAFAVNVVSGFNLGLAGVLGQNIGMNISSNKIVFVVVGILYLVSAYHLYTRWKGNGEKLF